MESWLMSAKKLDQQKKSKKCQSAASDTTDLIQI